MITAPYGTSSFYVLNVEDDAAQFLMKKLLPTQFRAVKQGFVTSTDFPSDISAAAELQTGMDTLVEQVYGTSPLTKGITFNPLYLPQSNSTLEASVELNNDGEVLSIGGFTNPYVIMDAKIGPEGRTPGIRGIVNYRQFELPAFEDIFEQGQYS